MSDVVVYDDTAAAANGTDNLGNGASFSFTTSGSAPGSLVDVKLELEDKSAANDGGYVAVKLYNNAAGMNAPGAEIGNVGTIDDSSLNANGSGTLVDIPLTASTILSPSSRYWISVSLAGGSNATLNYEGPTSGTGVSGEYFQAGGAVTSNTPGGAEIAEVTEEVVCFATGTSIRTTRGDCAVEDLVVGDIAVTASGGTRPVTWIGHRDINCRGQHDLHPVRIAAHAFGADLPARDLWLSPGHPVLVGADEDNDGGHLVPIMCLINGTTISRHPVDAVTYWHVELDQHDILLAEDLPAESYLDWGDRLFFTDGADHRLANPDFVVPGLAGRCRPVALDGPVVEAERRRLDAVFALRISAAAAWPSTATCELEG